MHNRDFRIQKAQETLHIIEQGGYTINNVEIGLPILHPFRIIFHNFYY